MTMTSHERHRPTAVTVLLLVIHALSECRDVTATGASDDRRSERVLVDWTKPPTSDGGRREHDDIMSPSGYYSIDEKTTGQHSRTRRSVDDEQHLSDTEDDELGGDSTSLHDDDEKRKWEKNTVRVWGKRGSDSENEDDDQVALNDANDEVEKRTWSKNKVRVWGKRRFDEDEADRLGALRKTHDREEDKRKWSDNKVRVWGKRRFDDDQDLTAQQALLDKVAAAARARLMTSSASNGGGRHGNNLTSGGRHQQHVTEDHEDGEISDTVEKRAAIVKRAIDESVSGAGRLVWVPGTRAFRPIFLGSSPSVAGRWTSGTDKRSPAAYGAADSGRYPSFYAAEGPKRSWRTNVIRVWGKRSAL